MFSYLDFETISLCNRRCPTCIRNSHPDRDAIAPWFETTCLAEEDIYGAVSAAVSMGFTGGICLSHYNEPLLDRRIAKIAAKIKTLGQFEVIYLHSNGDFVGEEFAKELDKSLDRIVFTLYMDEPKRSEKASLLHSLFPNTICDVITESAHIPTHFSPAFLVNELAEKYKNHPCLEPSMRVIINHRRQYLLCCDDVIGNFNLGKYPEKSLADHWAEKEKIQRILAKPGGRDWHSYCRSCPRP